MKFRIACILILILTVLYNCSPKLKKEYCCRSRLSGKGLEHYSIRTLGKEYQSLKKRNNKCCDNFGSDLHKLMQVLAVKLNTAGADTSSIIRIIGTPDAREVPKQYGAFISGNENIMIYRWRGWRDFLYFITENGKVKYAKWFYAYE